jgi:hypothetical protein
MYFVFNYVLRAESINFSNTLQIMFDYYPWYTLSRIRNNKARKKSKTTTRTVSIQMLSVGKGTWMQLIRNDDYVIIKHSNTQTKSKLLLLVFVLRASNKVIKKLNFQFPKN